MSLSGAAWVVDCAEFCVLDCEFCVPVCGPGAAFWDTLCACAVPTANAVVARLKASATTELRTMLDIPRASLTQHRDGGRIGAFPWCPGITDLSLCTRCLGVQGGCHRSAWRRS